MTNAEKAERLRQVVNMLEQADGIMRQTLGDTDSGLSLHYGFDSLIEDLWHEIQDLDLS